MFRVKMRLLNRKGKRREIVNGKLKCRLCVNEKEEKRNRMSKNESVGG